MLPNHVAIIPDGNRRWAKTQGLKATQGHAVGMETFNEIVRELFSGVPYITFWGASEDNLTKRTSLEVAFLSRLVAQEVEKWIRSKEFIQNEVRVRFVGHWRQILKSKKLNYAIKTLEAQTVGFNKHFLTILFGYDGKHEMIEAIKKLEKSNDPVNETTLKKSLWTGFLPDVDLVIRTGGEPHWSAGFLMWHTANSQLYFTDTLWPAFTKKELHKALQEYEKRERRFGK